MKVLFAGHSLGFAAPIGQRARAAGAETHEDRWRAHGDHDEETSHAALSWAETILCEWCLGNAAWYSQRKRPDQRLVVRFHRMEAETGYPAELDLARVDAMVFVASHVLAQACERFGWDAEDPRFHVIPNGIDPDALHAPKLPAARFTLAMIGYVPQLKRLDRALDVLDLLRARDNRYRLLVKGRPPWQYGWMANRPEERRYFVEQLRRIDRSPNLRSAVVFEPFGDDVPAFLRQAGWIVSTSDVEGHSVALAEGMASGAVPVILDRLGANEQYEPHWVHPDANAAAQAILLQVGNGNDAATEFAARWSWERLWPQWEQLLLREPVRV